MRIENLEINRQKLKKNADACRIWPLLVIIPINPKTGQPIKIAAYMQPRFKAGIKLKEACNRNEKSKKQ